MFVCVMQTHTRKGVDMSQREEYIETMMARMMRAEVEMRDVEPNDHTAFQAWGSLYHDAAEEVKFLTGVDPRPTD